METEPDVIAMDWEVAEMIENGTGGSFVQDCNAPDARDTAIQEKSDVADLMDFCFDSSDDEDNLDFGTSVAPIVEVSTGFDMKILQQAIETSTESLDLVAGKDVVLIAGKTGVGKSTLMQGIAGKHIISCKREATVSGQTAMKTVFEAEDPLPSFEIGHAKKSKTRSLNAFLRRDAKGNDIVYLDSPGLDDTGGIEIDIATSAVLSQVSKRCKSLKFVILIHCASLLEDRGGAFRTVLKFARTFVQDFDESKMSFTFLFTHSDEIASMTASISDARKRLQEEIILTYEGTTDPNVLSVLSFIRKSLKKGYPFADIFHPLKMDFSKFVDSVENQLTQVTDLDSARVCNLTLSSKLRLESAVQNLLRQLRLALKELSVDVCKVKDIESRLHFLGRYIEVACVRQATIECDKIISDYVSTLKESIDNQINLGLSPDVDFSDNNSISLKDGLRELDAISGHLSSESRKVKIERGLEKLQQEIISRANNDVAFHKELHRLRVWTRAFPQFGSKYKSTLDELRKFLDNISDEVRDVDFTNLQTMSQNDLSSFVTRFFKLHDICEYLALFPINDISIEKANEVRDHAMDSLSSTLEVWSLSAAEIADPKNTIDHNFDLEVTAKSSHVLEYIHHVIEHRERESAHITKGVVGTMERLEEAVVVRFTDYCMQLSGSQFSYDWEVQFLWARGVCNQFSSLRRERWRRLPEAFDSVINNAKSILYKMSRDLQSKSSYLKEQGMREGKSLAQSFLHLKNSQWFDSILPPDHSFVSRDCTKIESAIKSRFDKISISAEKCFKNLPTPQINSPENINKIGLLLPEFKEFESYSDIMYPSSSIIQQALATTESNIDGGKLQYSKRCVEELEKYTDFLGDLSNKYCVVFVEAYHSGRFGCVRSLSRKLNLVLSLADSLQSTDASLAVIQKSGILIQNIEEKCVLLSSHINSEFSSFAGDFNRKAALFTTLKEICTVFTRISEYLPDFKKIQLELRDLISSEALSIEDEMEASSNWEEIDKKLVHFKAAHVLDEISRNEVTRNLTSLLRQRDQKEVQVDGLLQEMIRENNFRGISEFIAPYHKSHDQIKQQKFRMYQREIGSSLEVIIHQTHRILDVETLSEESLIRQASINMAIVKDAKCELQALLLERLNLQSEIRKLHQKTSTISNAFIKKMYHAMGSKDFVQLARVEKNANAFHLHMENHLHLSIKKKLNDVTRKSKSAVDEIPKYLEQVFSSEFKSVEDLSESMSSLREASEMNDDASVGHLIAMYEKMKADIAAGILRSLRIIKEAIAETQCIDDVMPIVHAIKRQLNGPLQAHCSTDLLVECESVIEHMREIKKNHDTQFDFSGGSHVRYFDDCLKKLDKLKEFSWRRWSPWWHSDKRTYENFRDGLRGIVERRYNQARDYLNARDFVSVQECIDFLKCADERIRRHVAIVKSRLDDLQTMCVKHYLTLCDKAKQLFLSGKSKQFKELFADYRGFVLHIPCVLKSPEGKKEFSLINQLLFESLEKDVSKVKNLADEDICNFKLLRSQVLRTRDLGSFYADRLTLLHEELNCCPHSISEIWLEELHSLCWKHFFHGRDLSNIKHCAFLGVTPSATEAEINRAYRDIAKRYHPDKVSTTEDDNGSKFRKAKEAREALLKNITQSSERTTQAFDEELIAVGVNLHNAAKKFMMEQRYDQAEKLLFSIPQMRLLDDLVDPGLDSDGVVKSIYKTIKGYIEKVRIEVDSHWSGRKYKELNDSITDLKEMELHFKAYPQIFPASWDKGIIKSIEREIELLSEKANTCLQSHHVAKQKEAEFRRCFIDMGFVLVELPSFKDFTKSVMSNVLEKCLDADWGYSYLFELGLSLQRGDESSNETENRVAQMLVSEFNHFKEVITMTWNQETSQKPAKDVVAHIKGEHRKSSSTTTALFTDHELLLDTYNSFDQEYKSFLGEYIRPEADLKALAHKILDMAEKMKPFDCDSPLRDEVKQNIPILLAGVFSLFTILKSGASYNRISESSSSSDLGEKILMKPHNIQVLTILFMLGCGRESNSHLDSQLMEIRTGEGKSMILGAAATMLGLLGFSVRTVCYSEYLSSRDFKLFEEVFDHLKLTPHIKYSKITTYAEDCTAEKGDIRALTGSLLRGTLKRNYVPKRSGKSATFSLPQPRVENSIITLGDSRSMSNNFKHIDEVEPCTSSAIHTSDEKVNNSYSTDKTLGTSALAASPYSRDPSSCDDSKRREILLVDEVDVFFGSEFYGQTYNQVVDYKEPEIEEILRRVWNSYHQGGQCMNLSDVQSMPEYSRLLGKMPTFSYLLENEVSLMLDQMKKVDDVPYYIDSDNNRIGYKVMDTISYEATYGYATVFAYLKESANMKKSNTISQVLAMPISCGQFSYANISPYRILGVSGTLQALGEYEKSILSQYGLNKFIYVPSVYGSSNFQFDKAGDGIYFEENTSNFFHRISAEIIAATKSRRAVIVFFQNRSKLDMFVSNPIFHQLGRNKKLLTEDMEPNDKEYVISKAATSGQITICTAVFGRGTDFFCKDEGVQNNGGVHIIQTFLSEQISEEIQIQGRTARQGKRGSYQMVLLESDLVSDFGVAPGEKDKIPKKDLYDWLCKVRLTNHGQKCKVLEENLKTATEKDSATRTYFDALLEGNSTKAERDFIELYQLIKKPPFPTEITIDLALAIDSTGSMAPYAKCITSTIEKLLTGQNSLVVKLTDKFPEIDFAVRVGCLSYRDIDDKSDQFKEAVYDSGCHFSNHVADAVAFVKKSSKNFSGGSDLAEDHIGAIHHCATVWNHEADWISEIKCILLVTDAPAHGFVPPLSNISDDYNTRHPLGLTFHDTISKILSKGIDLFLCSFNPCATYSTEEEASLRMRNHPDNTTGKDVLRIPMVPVAQVTPSESRYRHIIFVLDESGSMQYSWTGVISAYNQYISKRQQSQCVSDLVSVVQFNDTARVTERMVPLSSTHKTLSYHGGGTCFYPAALEACQQARNTPHSHYPVIIFMSDGQANDADSASREFSVLNDIVSADTGDDLELHVISFGNGTDVSQLQMIARASKAGKVHCSADVANLATIFVNIATNQDVATLLEAEIAKRISDAVSDKISLEYFSS